MSAQPSVQVTQEEFSRLWAILAAAGGLCGQIQLAAFHGEPHSKERARHARRGRFVKTFQPRSDEAAEARTAAILRSTIDGKFTGNVALVGIFYRSTMRHADYDNLLKHVGDAANTVIWHDDAQVTAGAGIVEFDPANPRTVLAFAPHRSTMLRGTNAVRSCEACGDAFPLAGAKRFCGVACAAAGRRKGFIPLVSKGAE